VDRWADSLARCIIADDFDRSLRIVAKGADPNLERRGVTPLLRAVQRSRRATARSLLQAGALPNMATR
jgi:hypothetical protein